MCNDTSFWCVTGDIDVEAPYFDVQKFSPVKSDTEYAEFLSSRYPVFIL